MPDDPNRQPLTEPEEEQATPPGEDSLPEGEHGSGIPEDDDIALEMALLEQAASATHAVPVGPVDIHSVRTDAPVTPVQTGEGVQQTPPSGPAAPVTPVVKPVADATKQATQAAVTTAKQATQQVTAAVQNQAQKITVAPRKAIYRGKRFLFIYGGAVGAAGLMAILARRYRYFPADVGIARMIQRPKNALYDDMMTAVSQLGWRWISVGTRASMATLMWAAGFRMESVFTVSTWSGDILTSLIKHPVNRPRPTRDLVRVVSSLTETSFPSGHVVHYVTFYGFLFYLVFIHLKQRWFRTALLTLLAGIILLVGPSRVYMGHHWPSDVTGAYLVGTLWLGLLIIAYIETKANYTLHTRPPFFVKRAQQIK